MAVAHQASAAILGQLVGMAPEKGGDFRLDSMGQKGPGARAQHLGQRIARRPWLGKLENVTLGHGVSLLRWRSGGSNTPTIRRLTPSRRHQLPRIAPHEARPRQYASSLRGRSRFRMVLASTTESRNTIISKLGRHHFGLGEARPRIIASASSLFTQTSGMPPSCDRCEGSARNAFYRRARSGPKMQSRKLWPRPSRS